MTMAKDIPKNIRVDDDLWRAALERAGEEGHTLSGLIRQWIGDYVETGTPVAKGRRPKIRLTAAERKVAIAQLEEYFVPERMLDSALDAINYERG